jgi:hypothetical protein
MECHVCYLEEEVRTVWECRSTREAAVDLLNCILKTMANGVSALKKVRAIPAQTRQAHERLSHLWFEYLIRFETKSRMRSNSAPS